MGIAAYIAEAIIREHKHRPVDGDVVLLGRQSMQFSPNHAIDLLRAQGVEPATSLARIIDIDTSTRAGVGNAFIKDSSFFQLLGARSTKALDHSSYEGAEIIHDLNTPLPNDLENIADFVVDGSTLDNLFSPSTALQSITRMLRPGGRFLSVNMGSPHYSPYTVLTPFWFYDYLALNNYDDYRVYITLHGRRGELNVFALNTENAQSGPAFPVIGLTGIIVFGEKGPETTWDRLPSQRFYANQQTLSAYGNSAARLVKGRPELLQSKGSTSLSYSPSRHIIEHYLMAGFIIKNFVQIDHYGKRRMPSVPPSLAVARWIRKHFAPNWLP